jgi:hypothetical protein
MIDRNIDKVICMLRSVGAKGCLDEDNRLALVRKDRINRKAISFWETIAENLSRSDLENLFRGLVIAERELKWIGGSAAAGIWVFRIYEQLFKDTSVELANWALKNRGSNRYIPFGGYTHATSYDAWVTENQVKEGRYGEHLREQQCQQEAKVARQVKRLECHKARLRDGKMRATLIKEYNESLSLVDVGERLKLIANSDMPLESVDKELFNEVLVEFPALDTETKNILLKRIDRRDRSSWGRIKRILLSRG